MDSQRLSYTGKGNELALLMFKNVFFTIITLGVYSAWGRTNMRRYIWGNTFFMGDRATYTGQPKELLKGWFIVIGVYLTLAIVVQLVSKFISPLLAVLMLPIYLYLYCLVVYGGTRYRLSKTSWRGISFGLDKDKGSTRAFIKIVFLRAFLSFITLGLLLPAFKHHTRKFLTDKMRLGSVYFHYQASASEYSKLCYKGVFFSIITFGFYLPWFSCDLVKFRLERTAFQELSFKVHLTGKEMFKYSVFSFVLGLVTLGLATPWIINWGNNLIINSVEVKGSTDFSIIHNLVSEAEATGDVAAVEYDIDLAF